MSHDNMATVPAAQTGGQAGPAPTAAIAPVVGDVATGKLVFRKCQACHSLESGKNGLGPSLAGLIGKKASSVPNYNYSPAMKGSNLTWDVGTLAPNTSGTIVVTAQLGSNVPVGTALTNAISITVPTNDPTPTNNVESKNLTVGLRKLYLPMQLR